MGKLKKYLEQLAIVHPNAVGLDIGAREIYGCVASDESVKKPDLRLM